MAPKKDKKAEAPKKEGFTEVEKTFLELQLAECNNKVARLRLVVENYEQRNEELQNAYDKLDEDRADIIAYLKKTLNSRNEENHELKEKVKGLEETREIETAQFHETVTELEKNFTLMKDQLTSENKLLAGKLNTLEEFRAIRDDLMRKFEKQEQAFKDQEMKYKRIIYDAEKKFVIGKDKLKKEMEARLLQLAQDFQDATELRIAASTHRVIRENIAINNELDSILATQAKLADQNDKFKESERDARVAMELAEEERDKAINKNVVQLKVIDQLTNAFQEIKKEKALFEKRTFDLENLNTKLQKITKENEQLSLNVRILEQNLHARLSDQNKFMVESSKISAESHKLKRILKEAAFSIQAALKLDNWATSDPTREIMDRQSLLQRLLEIVTQYREVTRAESTDTIASFGKVYDEGDLGFVPKPMAKKSAMSTTVSVGASKEYEDEKESANELSISSSSLGSLKTIPSVNLVPPSSGPELAVKDSVPSFITSSHSTLSDSGDAAASRSSSESDIKKKIEESRLEIQKSIMKDLAYSQATEASKGTLTSKLRLTDETSKSVIFDQEKRETVKEEVRSSSLAKKKEQRHSEDDSIKGDKRVSIQAGTKVDQLTEEEIENIVPEVKVEESLSMVEPKEEAEEGTKEDKAISDPPADSK